MFKGGLIRSADGHHFKHPAWAVNMVRTFDVSRDPIMKDMWGLQIEYAVRTKDSVVIVSKHSQIQG